jgi:hypothetical protein
MAQPIRDPLQAFDVHVKMRRYGDEWAIDLFVRDDTGSPGRIIPVASGLVGEPFMQETFVNLVDHVRLLVDQGIKQIVEPM